MSDDGREYRIDYFLSAGECNAQSVIPMPTLVQRIIEVSTMHANSTGIGYANLHKRGLAWVLSRISIEMDRYPGINEHFSLTTWIESANRHFSERNVMVTDGSGDVIGYARTIWVAIDMESRRAGDMSAIIDGVPLGDRPCPIARQAKLQPVTVPDMVRHHRFRYCDIDFNRHVNSTRYVETILNEWGVEFFDRNEISRFDIAYMSEIHYNDVVEVVVRNDCGYSEVEIRRDGAACTRARLAFRPVGPQ